MDGAFAGATKGAFENKGFGYSGFIQLIFYYFSNHLFTVTTFNDYEVDAGL